MSKTINTTRTFTAAALDNELKRRKNNRKRRTQGIDTARAKGFVLQKMSKDQMDRVKAGEIVKVEFKSGRVEHVGLK